MNKRNVPTHGEHGIGLSMVLMVLGTSHSAIVSPKGPYVSKTATRHTLLPPSTTARELLTTFRPRCSIKAYRKTRPDLSSIISTRSTKPNLGFRAPGLWRQWMLEKSIEPSQTLRGVRECAALVGIPNQWPACVMQS